MQSLPHRYRVEANARPVGPVAVDSKGLETLSTAPPAEFGGPGDLWSPETILLAAVADCFVLTFRGVARASSFDWIELRAEAEGVLDRVDRVTRFTAIELRVSLTHPGEEDRDKALRLLEKSEKGCLITNSLACPVTLDASVENI